MMFCILLFLSDRCLIDNYSTSQYFPMTHKKNTIKTYMQVVLSHYTSISSKTDNDILLTAKVSLFDFVEAT